MKKNIFKKSILTVFFVVLISYFCLPAPTQASIFDAITTNLGIFNQGAELPTSNAGLEGIVIKVINTALSFLSIIFLILILYAGFLYMTAGGKKEQVKKAQDVLKDSLIGLAIIFVSYVFVNYIITEIIKLIKTA